MLKSLNIENIAVIEKADIEFSGGLNVLTGETGAGKSIIVDAINAILGERTSRELVRHGAEVAYVTAAFEDIKANVGEMLKAFSIPYDTQDCLVLSRRITAQGKSVCRINGTVCTVSMLREIGTALVNIHGQHDSQELLNPECHYKFVDMLCDDKSIFDAYYASFKNLVAIRKKLKALSVDADERDKKLELLDYQINELTAADIKIGEWDELKKEKNVISNSRSIIETLNTCLSALSGDDETVGIVSGLKLCEREMQSIENADSELKSISDYASRLAQDAEDLKENCLSVLSDMDFSEERLEKIEEKLNVLYDFSNKYGETEKDMLDYLAKAVSERESLVNSDEELEKLNAQYDEVFDKTVELAQQLSQCRHKTAEKFEKDVKEQLEFLDMPKISFVVHFDKGNLSSTGFDKIEFLISANPGEPPKPLSKIASGGELSRIMLAVKNIIAKADTISTLIFDEIDTGVSGRASRKIGLKLKSVAQDTQVICVTHSAQIASVADNHYLIEKQYKNDRTFTNVKLLDYEGRKYELARIMGGIDISDTMLKSAVELLQDC